jgi:hypothetical protein
MSTPIPRQARALATVLTTCLLTVALAGPTVAVASRHRHRTAHRRTTHRTVHHRRHRRRRHGARTNAKPLTQANQLARQSSTSAQKQAPTITVTGDTLSWNGIKGVNSYVLVRKVPGQPDEYSIVKATSVTPPVVPGATVKFSVRTNLSGSYWAPEVSIAYPPSSEPSKAEEPVKAEEPAKTEEPVKAEEPAKTEEPAKAEEPASTPHFEMGTVAGSAVSYELPFAQRLGTHTARMEFSISTPVSQIAPAVEAYAKAGIKPLLLAGFYGKIPSVAEAQNLANWAAAFGPGGTFWKGKTFPAGTAVTDIEFGNETSYAYQFSDTSKTSNWYSLESYKLRAQEYALRFSAAYTAIHAVNAQVGLLAQADDGGSGSSEWVKNMFLAVPELGKLAAGWTIHPYGPKWESAINRLISQTSSVGGPSTVPIFVTEWGLSTDNGRCLSDNYGFNKCMTYQEAATTLESNLAGMRSRYGTRLAAFYLFQARDQSESGASTSRESYFGALQSDEAAKGAYTTAVESLLTANP